MRAICVIDDDDDFRALIGEYLGSLGYPVLEFASAEEALGSLLAASPPLCSSSSATREWLGSQA